MVLVAQDISYQVSPSWKLLDSVSLEVKQGEVVCLTGENGCGKTTFINIIAGLIRNSGGKTLYSSSSMNVVDDISSWPLWKRSRAGIAYLPQGNRIWPHMTVDEHMSLCETSVVNAIPEDVRNMLRQLPMQSKASALSNGQQRLLLIARCFLMKPRLLLADEPTAGLDKNAQELVLIALKSLIHNGMAALIVEHDSDILDRLPGRRAVLKEGRIYES